jgi:hypothetical protein
VNAWGRVATRDGEHLKFEKGRILAAGRAHHAVENLLPAVAHHAKQRRDIRLLLQKKNREESRIGLRDEGCPGG